MADRPKTMEEILSGIISRKALFNPKMRGMGAVVLGGALALTTLLCADFFRVVPPVSLDFLAAAGPPYRVLLVIALALEGLLVVDRLVRHDEPPYPTLTQAIAMTVGALGVIAVGVGVVLSIVWAAVFSTYTPGLAILQTLGFVLMLVGSALLLAALPPFGASLVRPLVHEAA